MSTCTRTRLVFLAAFLPLAFSLVGCGRGAVSIATGKACSSERPCPNGFSCLESVCSPEQCTALDDCPGGYICSTVTSKCERLCESNSQCDGRCCSAGVCQDCSSSAPPEITAVDGTGSPDGAQGYGSQRLRDRLVIRGNNLAGATAKLIGSAGTHTLAPCSSPTDTELQVRLPEDVSAGDYTLSVMNQAGECNASLTLLRGEPGELQASAEEIVLVINQLFESNSDVHLTGTLPTNQALGTLFAVGSTSATAPRSIVINGAEQVDDITTAGLFMVVIDLATHAVVESSKAAFASASASARQELGAAIDQLGYEHVVILASQGDISAMAADATLAAKLETIGASARFAALAADEGYVLVGQRGLGEGGGLEQVAGTARAGIAVLATVLLDEGVVGLTTPRSIPGSAIVDGSVGAAQLAGGSVTSDKLADGSVGAAQLADSAVTTDKIVDGAVSSDKLAAGSVGLEHLSLDVCAPLEILRVDASGTAWECSLEAVTAADVSCSGCVADGEIESVAWGKLTGVPPGFADGVDSDTTYSQGSGIAIDASNVISATLGSSVEDDEITSVDWSKLTNVPAGVTDGGCQITNIVNHACDAPDGGGQCITYYGVTKTTGTLTCSGVSRTIVLNVAGCSKGYWPSGCW